MTDPNKPTPDAQQPNAPMNDETQTPSTARRATRGANTSPGFLASAVTWSSNALGLLVTWCRQGVTWALPHVRRAFVWTAKVALPGIGRTLRSFVKGLAGRTWFRSGVRISLTAAVLMLAGVGGLWGFSHRVPAGSIGVRQANWGGSGVTQADLVQGIRFSMPLRDQWYHLDAGTHTAIFAWVSEGGNEPMLQVATKDGEAVDVAVTVPYRIRKGEAHQLVSNGLHSDYPMRAHAILRRVLQEELSKLSAEDFADPERRLLAASTAEERLGAELGEVHLEPLDVLISTVLFTGPYEKKMLEKQLAGQTLKTNASIHERSLQEDALADVVASLKAAEDTRRTEWETMIDVARLAGEAAVREVQVSAKRFAKETEIDAMNQMESAMAGSALALQRVEDLRERLTHEALESAGGRVHLAREAAANLKISKVTLNSNDPSVPTVLDLDGLVEMLLGDEPESDG
jgi:hypothetical protein